MKKPSPKLLRILLIIATLVVGWLLYNWFQTKKRKKKEERERLVCEATKSLPNIRKAIQRFPDSKNYDSGYFTDSMLTNWKNSYSGIYEIIYATRTEKISLPPEDIASIDQFLDCYGNAAMYRTVYNKAFIQRELDQYSSFFDNIENRKLDLQQRTAIVTNEDNNLIIAGAGSGKTTTIVGKVGYVIDRYKIPPEEILLISFTKKSAETLAARIGIDGVEAKTFHKFGRDIIAVTDQKQPTTFDEAQFQSLITGFFKELVSEPAYLNKVISFFTNFLKLARAQDEFNNQGEYFQYLKDQEFTTYKGKTIPYQGKTTYKREVVKSIEECKIANFLLFNGIDYAYENPYEHETASPDSRQYKPDFTINHAGNKIYLEHFGLNKAGQVPHFFADKGKGQTVEQVTKVYTDGITWKRELHARHGTKLIETYSHEMLDDVLFDNLTQNLNLFGIQLRPKPPEEIWTIITEAAKNELDSFISLFQTFITLMKSNNYSLEEVKHQNKKVDQKFQQERNNLFLEIITPVYEKYQQYLADRKEIDFSDMINIAASYIASGQYKQKFSYVIIDEFQDISIGRYQIIKAIKKANPGCKLFCVGDDWQSIYRFSGSDISLFSNFEKYFGYAEKAKIETTYRFQDPLLSLSSQFILKNPNQTKKELKGINPTKVSAYTITYSVSENQDDTAALQSIFNELLLSGKATGKDILILGRYSFDINRIRNFDNIFHIDKRKETLSFSLKTRNGEVQRLTAKFMTVHKSKGLEADIVIVINCNSGRHGFPSGMSDDPVLNLLLSEADQFENGEERRLFYVAMTRAKESIYLVADNACKSKFIIELETGSPQSAMKKCPRCITADLTKKTGITKGKDWAFYACTNFMYGCTFKEWV